MSDIHTVGLDLFSFSDNGMRKPVSRITLYVNNEDDQVYTAGDDTGLDLSATCIYATEEMAKTLLSMAKGAQYQMYEAQAANLDAAAELGDGIEVGGITSVIAQINDNGDGYPDVSASGEQEVEDEYPGASRQGPIQRELSRARSLISKTNERISFEIYGEDGKGGLNGKMATYTVSLSTISSKVESVETKAAADLEAAKKDFTVKLTSYSTIDQTDKKIATEVRSVKEYTDGKVGDLDTAVSQKLTSYSTIEQTNEKITTSVSSSKEYTDGKVGDLDTSVTNRLKSYSTIEQTAELIATRVAKGSIISEINQSAEEVQISASKINLNGYVSFTALENGPDEDKGQTVIDGGWLTGVRLRGNKILGGTYTNLNEDTWFGLGENGGRWGFRLANTDNEEKGIFGVYNGDFGYTSLSGKSGYTFLMTDGSAQTSYPQGTWDFSQADLITKGEVGFVPVFQ